MKGESAEILVIDQGNSNVKISLWADGCLINKIRLPGNLSSKELEEFVSKATPEGCAYSSVSKPDKELIKKLDEIFAERLVVLNPNTPLPIKINYNRATPIGADRVAAVAGGVSMFPNETLLIIDAGTAITLDVADSSGNFIGGNISAGIDLRVKSLHEYTGRLPLVNKNEAGNDVYFATDTKEALLNGVMNGVCAEIADAFYHAKEEFGCRRMILTGGDSRLIEKMMRHKTDNLYVDEELVEKGLLSIYRYNSRQAI